MVGALVAGTVLEKLPWNKILIGVVIFVILYIIYRQGVKSGALGKPKKAKIPTDLVNITGAEVRRISTSLYDDMDGFNWSGHAPEPYEELSRLNDASLTAVYNDFNDQYINLEEGTLYEWLQAESYTDFTTADIVERIILPRMVKIGLT